jgi:hypothetical protein
LRRAYWSADFAEAHVVEALLRAHGVEAWVFDALLVRQTVMMRCHETAIVHTGPAARVNHARTPYACARARRDRRGR